MADDILKQEAGARQSHSEDPKTGTDHASLRVIHPDFAAMTVTITFSASQWCFFWRLLNVGSMLSDALLNAETTHNRHALKTAELWNRMSAKFAAMLDRDDVLVVKHWPSEADSD